MTRIREYAKKSGGKMMYRSLAAVAAFVVVVAFCGHSFSADGEPDGQRWWSHILVLADDGMEGRNTGSPGHRKAAEYVAQQFENAGLKPAGTEGYLQPVRFIARQLEEDQSSLTLVRDSLGEEASFWAATRSSARGSSRPASSRLPWSLLAMACRFRRPITTISQDSTSAANWWSS